MTILYKATPEGQVPYTEEEMAAWKTTLFDEAEQLKELAKRQYQYDRAAEYPPITDYIDGLVKGDQAQVQAYIDACLAVKAKYPKPSQT
jgi:inhibitor of KinA sporulation pathway (predicted exonuclease)